MQLSRGAIIRSTLLAVIGTAIAILVYQTRYQSSFFTIFYELPLYILGIITVIVSLIADIRSYIHTRKYVSYFSTSVTIVFCLVIWLADYIVQTPFNKPTLVKAHYNGDINGIGIDFKTDGTYIYNDWAVGISDYEYGTYTISGSTITLDSTKLSSISCRLLEIRSIEYKTYQDSIRKEKYLYQVNENGKVVDDFEFRVVEDNR